jgi:required for meiotic nuclear division protein 1
MEGQSHTMKLSAILVSSQLDIKGIRSFLDIKPLADSSTELLVRLSENCYQAYFNYGVVVFCGHSEDEMKIAIKSIAPFLKGPNNNWLRDDYSFQIKPGAELEFGFDGLVVDRMDDNVVRIAMLNLAQSVALDYFNTTSENLLTEVKGFTKELELKGRLSLSRKSMLKFIGKALSTQNEIADTIYIFDAPEMVWDNEFLDRLNQGLKKHFDLRVRFSEIEYTLRIINENLNTFREISNQKENSFLEWIIIILILVEVFDLLISKLL